MSAQGPTVYEFRIVFDAPMPFVLRWCTDYRPNDHELAKDGGERRILERTSRRIVYEDLEDSDEGWVWSRQTVTVHPPDLWHAEARGNRRNWSIDYRLRELPGGRTEMVFHGVRHTAGVGTKNPSQRALRDELQEMWTNYGRAMVRDYRASSPRRPPRPRPTRRRPSSP
jgi:hypothetical protein